MQGPLAEKLTLWVTCLKRTHDTESVEVQGMLQQHAWSEEQKPARLEQRNQRLTELGQDAVCGQPLFCVETAIKLFYFSALIYVYKEVTHGPLSLSCCSCLDSWKGIRAISF